MHAPRAFLGPNDKSTCLYQRLIPELSCAELVPEEASSSVSFRDCSIYTPEGKRLLMDKISLDLAEGESCLIMGPLKPRNLRHRRS